ncbi:alpha-1,2-mannosyltransferase [Coccidioides immitis RS]|uniref:Alpha-1,3/1,6-mannosyltransferase ALG2 n=1 Tax=Coccidioides immitis (strain RS) TaxID=246410 RepID=J3K320_COCIM|nr:alpha-1,2-mannosyltransferase [Coccidioides immitis RS]EAS28537.3 alpha-1,2-mannosyltransferase [Coccidioides immitis RS]
MPSERASSSRSAKSHRKRNIIFIHPDLGIGGAERLILDAALALQSRGHRVTIYTSHRDPMHCFEEARDGTLDVRVGGNTVFPAHVGGRLHVLMAVLRQLHLVMGLVLERRRKREVGGAGRTNGDQMIAEEDDAEDDVFIVDQVPACVPLLRLFGSEVLRGSRRRGRDRILFYCHFPDQLLARRDEGGRVIRLVKGLYRWPFDWFEGWAMSAADKVVANSRFTSRVVREVFGERLRDVKVLYPCVDTSQKALKIGDGQTSSSEEPLWGGLKVILSINRFERKKNIELAIRAYHGLGKQHRRGTRLVIAGKRGYDNRVQENVQYHRELDSLATNLGLETATSKTVVSALSIPASINVLFLLSVPSAFKQTLLSSSTLLLYTPSHEHFGIVPVEAMHAGLPLLAVNTGGPLETILDGKTGWLRDASSVEEWSRVIKQVLWDMNSEQLEEMGKMGQERVEKNFSLSAMGDRLEEEIDEMVSSARPTFVRVHQVILWVAIAGLAVSFLIRIGLGFSVER